MKLNYLVAFALMSFCISQINSMNQTTILPDNIRSSMANEDQKITIETIEKYLKELEEVIGQLGVGSIATASGRYYAMDRDKHWHRTLDSYRGQQKLPDQRQLSLHVFSLRSHCYDNMGILGRIFSRLHIK